MKILTTLLGAALTLCGGLSAQSNGERITVRFTTPVLIGETTFPAGECDIQVVRSSSDNIVLVMRSHDGPNAGVLVNRFLDFAAETVPGRTSVILDRRGDTYRLNRIVLGDRTGYQLNYVE